MYHGQATSARGRVSGNSVSDKASSAENPRRYSLESIGWYDEELINTRPLTGRISTVSPRTRRERGVHAQHFFCGCDSQQALSSPWARDEELAPGL